MSDLTAKAKAHGIPLTLVVVLVGLLITLFSTLQILKVFGVVYEDTIHAIEIKQKEVDKVQNVRIEQAEEDLQVHDSMPGHGVGVRDAHYMAEKVERIERNQEQTQQAVQDLIVVTTELKTEVNHLRTERRTNE